MQLPTAYDFTAQTSPDHFGALLKWLRDRHGIAQAQVVAHLPGTIDQQRYSSFELNKRSPTFDELSMMYKALREAGVRLSLRDRNLFLDLAKQHLETKKTHKVRKSPQEWDDLRGVLAAIDQVPDAPSALAQLSTARGTPLPSRMEISHLVGRQDWLDSLYGALAGQPPVKWVILQGPPGVGKTSELHRIANYFQQHIPRYYVVLCKLPERDLEALSADIALEILLSDILQGIGPANAPMPMSSLQARMKYVLDCMAHADRCVLILLDNAEHILDEHGQPASIWQQFCEKFVHVRHRASFVLGTKEWPARFTMEAQWTMQAVVPTLTQDEGIGLLRRLGLHNLSEEQLGQAVEAVGGVPVCLEWIAKLMREPFLQGDWSAFEEEEDSDAALLDTTKNGQRLTHLLEDASLFGGPVAMRLTPLLDRVLARLSPDASAALRSLALAPVPLGAAALKVLYQDPAPLQELRDASLLAAYRKRVQLLPMVAAAIRSGLSAQQKQDLEERLVNALLSWVTGSRTLDNREMGMIISALAEMYLRHHRLLDAAQFILRYGWLAFNLGHARKIAQLALACIEEVRQETKGQLELQQHCGASLLYTFLAPMLGYKIDGARKEADYRTIYDAVHAGTLRLHPPILVFITHNLMLQAMNEHRFEDARQLLDTTCASLASITSNEDLQASLLEKRAWLFGRCCDYQNEQGARETERTMREQAVALYRQSSLLLANSTASSPLIQHFLNKRQAKVLNYLGYHLSRLKRYEEALQALLESLRLQKQGDVELDSLPPLYGDIAQTLLALGCFREAKDFDELAYIEAERLAHAGYAFSQEELHIHRANRGNLYLHLGRVDEAEVLLQEALPHIHPRRSMYKVMATRAHEEIQQWRKLQGESSSHYQLDWRYVGKYRQLASYDTYWWWGAAGPFTQEEQHEWDQWFISPLDEKSKEQLGQVIRQSRNREIEAALDRHREPRFHYPALDIEQVRTHIQGFLELDAQIRLDENLHPLVRQWYEEAIEEEIIVLHLIEATYEGSSERVRELNRQLIPEPKEEEMAYAISRVRRLIIQGKLYAERFSKGDDPVALEKAKAIREAADQMVLLVEQLGIQVDLAASLQEKQELLAEPPLSPVTTTASMLIPHQAAIRFVEVVLQQAGYAGWRVIPDPLSRDPHLEQALQHVYLPTRDIPVDQLKDYVRHELLDGHVARCVAGEQSLIGLLGIHLSNSLEMEEGLATYKEIQNAAREGRAHDESGIWFGTLAVGLAAGVMTSPQTFSRLFTFFAALIYLYRLVKRPDQSAQVALERAQAIALGRCLRTYRGVPDLTVPSVCYTKDVLYQRGLHKIMRALEEDSTVIERLAVGVVALEHLPDLKDLGIVTAPQALTTMMQDAHIDEYILSFVHPDEEHHQL